MSETPQASETTRRAIAAASERLPFHDTQDFDDTERGFVARSAERRITAADGRVVWDLDAYAFLEGEAADDGQPQPVAPGAAADRGTGCSRSSPASTRCAGYDLSVMTLVEGERA